MTKRNIIMIATLVMGGLLSGFLVAYATTQYRTCPDSHSANWFSPSCQPGNKQCSNGDKYTLNVYGSCPNNPGCGQQGTGNYPHYMCAGDSATYNYSYGSHTVAVYGYAAWYYPWTGGGSTCSGTCTSNCYADKNPTSQAYYFGEAGTWNGSSCSYSVGMIGYVNQYTASGWVYLSSIPMQSGTCPDQIVQLDANCENSLSKRIYYDGVEYIY